MGAIEARFVASQSSLSLCRGDSSAPHWQQRLLRVHRDMLSAGDHCNMLVSADAVADCDP